MKKLENNLTAKYTIAFIITSMLALGFFAVNGKSLVWEPDGFRQHVLALTYYGEWLRDIINNLVFEHTLEIPLWSFSLGYGSDILTTLNYYVIGDPLTLLSIFVPAQYTEYLYDFLVIFRLYLAGLAFMHFCKVMGRSGNGIIAGSIVYVFSGYTLFATVRHPMFVIPMIMFPIILAGAEKIFQKKRPYQFILSIALLTISNFYFLYMVAVLAVVYVIVRCVFLHNAKIFEILKTLFKMLGYAIIAVMMAAVIFIPILIAFSGNYRSEVGNVIDVFYELGYYKSILSDITTSELNSYWTLLGFSPIIFPTIYMMLKDKNKQYKIFAGLCVIFLCFPIFGTALNGFSYVSNRWTWALGLCLAFMIVNFWDKIVTMGTEEMKRMVMFTGVYFVILYLIHKSSMENALAQIVILLLMITGIFVCNEKHISKRKIEYVIILLVIASVYINGYYRFSVTKGNYVADFMDSGQVYNTYQESVSNDLKENVEDDTFYRYGYVDDSFFYDSETSLANVLNQLPKEEELRNNFGSMGQNENAPLLFDMNGMGFYWSLTNGNLWKYMESMDVTQRFLVAAQGMDDRAALSTLASSKYYVSEAANYKRVPFGFEQKTTIEKSVPYSIKKKSGFGASLGKTSYYIYENKYALPLGYTYESYILEEDFEKMSAIEKEETMLQSVVLENGSQDLKEKTGTITSQSLDYDIRLGDNVKKEKKSFVVDEGNSSIAIMFSSVEDCELFFVVKGLNYEETNPIDLYKDKFDLLSKNEINKLKATYTDWTESYEANLSVHSNGVKKTINYRTSENMYYMGNDDYTVNIGYSDDSRVTMVVTFSKPGIYSYDEIEVVKQPMSNYAEQIDKLREDVLEDVKIGNNQLTGEIEVDTNKMLCLTIPYNGGWTALVDGQEVELEKVNLFYSGINLSEGKHQIELRYATPGLKAGCICSLIGIIAFILLVIAQSSFAKNKNMIYCMRNKKIRRKK